MSGKRQELLTRLERYYRELGWPVERGHESVVHASGPGGVTWIGMAVVPEDLGSEDFESRLVEASEQRMPRGELCPLELLPSEECALELRGVLDRLGLSERGHVEVYSIAA